MYFCELKLIDINRNNAVLYNLDATVSDNNDCIYCTVLSGTVSGLTVLGNDNKYTRYSKMINNLLHLILQFFYNYITINITFCLVAYA